MSASGFTLRLEFVAERPGLEPVEIVQEFPDRQVQGWQSCKRAGNIYR